MEGVLAAVNFAQSLGWVPVPVAQAETLKRVVCFDFDIAIGRTNTHLGNPLRSAAAIARDIICGGPIRAALSAVEFADGIGWVPVVVANTDTFRRRNEGRVGRSMARAVQLAFLRYAVPLRVPLAGAAARWVSTSGIVEGVLAAVELADEILRIPRIVSKADTFRRGNKGGVRALLLPAAEEAAEGPVGPFEVPLARAACLGVGAAHVAEGVLAAVHLADEIVGVPLVVAEAEALCARHVGEVGFRAPRTHQLAGPFPEGPERVPLAGAVGLCVGAARVVEDVIVAVQFADAFGRVPVEVAKAEALRVRSVRFVRAQLTPAN